LFSLIWYSQNLNNIFKEVKLTRENATTDQSKFKISFYEKMLRKLKTKKWLLQSFLLKKNHVLIKVGLVSQNRCKCAWSSKNNWFPHPV